MEVGKDQLLSFSYGEESWKATPHFAPIYHRYFHSGIQAAIDNHGELIKQGKRKTLYLLRLPFENQTREYFLKVYSHHGLSSRLKACLKRPRGMHEFYTGLKIVQRDIPTIVPCAAGIRKLKSTFLESYFVSEKMEAVENLNVFFLGGARLDDSGLITRKTLMEDFGSLVRKMHNKGVLQKDLAPNNFLLGIGKKNLGMVFLIDYERVKIVPTIREGTQRWALSKLSRIGTEVSLPDRLRFLHAFRPGLEKDIFKAVAKDIDCQTIRRIKKDIHHSRISNVHTAILYASFQQNGYQGFYHKEYDLNSLLRYVGEIDHSNTYKQDLFAWKNADGQDTTLVRAARDFPQKISQSLWALMWGLKLGRIPIIEPLALVSKRGRNLDGFVIIPIKEKALTLSEFLQKTTDHHRRQTVYRQVIRILKHLHLFGTFFGNLSGDEFMVEKNPNRYLSVYLHNAVRFKIVKKSDKRANTKDLEAIADLFTR
ncbi:MAG: hypothetical protein J7M06_00530 [Proteobacteria bacterium]|nr:hypothetical protein [Pseudomonadota bacterium]